MNSRPHNQNLIVISETAYRELEKLRRNAEYLAKLEHSIQQFKEGKVVAPAVILSGAALLLFHNPSSLVAS
mgnify:FL=1|jgi:toxin-antitoxin system, antitoxin component, PHD family